MVQSHDDFAHFGPCRVGVLDDDHSFRETLCDIIGAYPGLALVGAWADLPTLLAEEPWEQLDVMVSDLFLGPIENGTPLPDLFGVATRRGGLGIVVLSSQDPRPLRMTVPEQLRPSVEFLQKRPAIPRDSIVEAIHRVHAGSRPGDGKR
jgi:FixJ family two-component response regulator